MSKMRLKEYFTYNTGFQSTFLPLAGNTTGTSVIGIDKDAEFVIARTMGQSNTDALGTAQTVAPPVLISWRVNQQVYDNGFPMPFNVLYGTAQLPHVPFQPIIIVGGNTFQVVAQNQTAGTSLYLYLCHEGYKHYYSKFVEVED